MGFLPALKCDVKSDHLRPIAQLGSGGVPVCRLGAFEAHSGAILELF